MTRDEWKERLPLIQAFVEGKTIQYLDIGHGWVNVPSDLGIRLNDNISNYRIKPEPKVIWVRGGKVYPYNPYLKGFQKFVEVTDE